MGVVVRQLHPRAARRRVDAETALAGVAMNAPSGGSSLAQRVRGLHINERNGYGPGDCHCDECVYLMDELSELDLEIARLQANARQIPRDLVAEFSGIHDALDALAGAGISGGLAGAARAHLRRIGQVVDLALGNER